MKEKDFDWCNDSGYSDVFDNSLCECTAPQVNDGMCICGRPINNTMMHDNKLIAEFMGLENHFKNEGGTKVFIDGEENVQNWECYDTERGLLITPIEMQYHTSWDWLMPVIHRIRDHVNVDMGFEEFDDWRENFKQIDPYNYSLEQCYEAVVEFIKEYNNED